MSRRISAGNWIIPAVRKHIIPQEALAGAAVGIGVEKALNDGVIISALEIIEARLLTIVLSVYRFRRLFFVIEKIGKQSNLNCSFVVSMNYSLFIIRHLCGFLQQFFEKMYLSQQFAAIITVLNLLLTKRLISSIAHTTLLWVASDKPVLAERSKEDSVLYSFLNQFLAM